MVKTTKFFVIFCFLSVFFLNSTAAFSADKVLDIKEVTSKLGIKAWLVEDHSVPVIVMEFAFRNAGSAYDQAELQGLSQLASNTMDEGAGSLDAKEFQATLQNLSIDLRFKSGRDSFGGSLKTLTKNKQPAFDLLQIALKAPRFEKEAVDRMREANMSRIRSSLSNPEWIAARLQNDIAFKGHPYARNSGGTLSSLPLIKPEHLKEFHKRNIGKNNVVVAVAGDITEAQLSATLDYIFGSLPDVESGEVRDLTLQNEGKTYFYHKDVPQSVIEMIQPGIARDDPRYDEAQIMNFILGSSGFGSRLTEEIREKRGLTYGIYSQFYNLDHVNALTVATSTEAKNTTEMIDLVKAEFVKLRSESVSEEELADAKSYLIGSLPLSLTSTDRIAGILISLQMDGLPIDYLDQRKQNIKNATTESILEISRELLKPEAMSIVIVGQAAVPDAIRVESLPNAE
ncbi:MAG: insulinase family protein [Micavibrio sp.]|nr:insulinase family protein [Micavibrio sp.]